MNVPIVVAAYNRPASLARLLKSLQKSDYNEPVKLIISIDGGGSEMVLKTAEAFKWPFGDKEIIHHKENLGLRRHILSCGDIALGHDGVILLEDDLYVSPRFYNYALSAMQYYSSDDSISGIALYAHAFNETACFPFYPLMDGSDVFFIQLACSWGQCWTKKQWALFREWLKKKGESTVSHVPGLPGDIALWPDTSWKKLFTIYMIEQNLFFVFPRQSYTTNFGDEGQHFTGIENFQVPLQYGKKTTVFTKLDDSYAIYDAFCEILPDCLNMMCEELQEYDYCVDLYGTKLISDIPNDYILTSKNNRTPVIMIGKKMIPLEVNIIEKIEGEKLFFTKTKDCIDINCFIKQRKKLCNSKEEIFYHYKLPARYRKKLSLKPGNFLISSTIKIKNRLIR